MSLCQGLLDILDVVRDVCIQVITAIKKRINIIGALKDKKLLALQSFEQTIKSVEVKEFLKKLLPFFEKKTVFVMDNASFHKKQEVLELFCGTKHQVLFLPTYSPALNPIEHYCVKAQAYEKEKSMFYIHSTQYYSVSLFFIGLAI